VIEVSFTTRTTEPARRALSFQGLSKRKRRSTCCGGALVFSEPEKSQAQIKRIIESAYDYGAEMIVTPARCAR